MRRLAKTLVSRMPELSVERSAARVLQNARVNRPLIRRTIADLRDASRGTGSAIVVSAGPSLHRKHPVPQILASRYRGTIVATDSALGTCLRNGLVPEYVVTLDPHSARVCRWFGDARLEGRPADDYFQRQELDPHLAVDERVRNQELVGLVNRAGSRMKAIIATGVYPEAAQRCAEAGLELYWWNPILDDPEDARGFTQQLYRMNRAPCMVSGGNVGSAAWVFAHAILEKPEVAVVGMDLGYAPDIPLEKTQYYAELRELFGDRAHEAVISVYNPHLKETWYADPAYYWYRQGFLQMAAEASCVTYNCTEGGTVFGKPLKWMPLQTFLRDGRRGREGS